MNMLFHVTMTHTPDNCPAYHPEAMPGVITGMDKLEGVGKELNVKVHFLLWGAPDHVAYALLEADSLGVIAQFVNAIPIRQEFRVTPVEHLGQVIETSKAMMARAKK
jgi:muconolactone delta-isomerase